MEKKFIRPIRRFVLLLDDQTDTVSEGGVIVNRSVGTWHHDFTVVRVGETEKADFGQGDRVVLEHPDAGRRVTVDGIVYRLVRMSDIIAVLDSGTAE